MALPDRSPIRLGTSQHSSRSAFLVKFPQDVWEQIVASGSDGIQVSNDDQRLSLVLPGRTIGLDSQPQNPTEIYELSSSLNPLGLASTRLSVPYAIAPSAIPVQSARVVSTRDPKKASGQMAAGPNESASKLRQEAAVPISRSHSSPGTQPAAAAAAPAPVVPLKTRVVQHLALGPASVEEIIGRVGGAEADVMRVVKVVGRQVAENPPKYSLQPSQYTKIKLVEWKYTADEQEQVGRMAREAFDELEFPEGSEERVELERKLQEAAAATSPPLFVTERITSIPQTTHVVDTKPRLSPPSISRPSPSHTIESKPRPSLPTSSRPSSSLSSQTYIIPPPQQSSSSKPRVPASSSASSSTAKKGPVAREMAKFRAEQARSSSAPGSSGRTEAASPRAARTALPDIVPSKAVKKRSTTTKVEKADRSDTSSVSEGLKVKSEQKRKREKQLSPSPTLTFSDDSDEEETRGRAKKRFPKPAPSRSYIAEPTFPSSPPARIIPTFTKRKSPPEPLDLKPDVKSRTPSTVSSERPDDPEDLRDRYEELYPAYQLLTQKLSALHRAAEGVEGGEGDVEILPARGELEKMVKKWERWHNELAGIRKWFGTG